MGRYTHELKRCAGFTLIELVMVITILGILAGVALPKYLDLGRNARIAVLKQIEGSMLTVATNVHIRATLDGADLVGWNPGYVFNGQTIILANGYPSNRDIGTLLDVTETGGLELYEEGGRKRDFRYTSVSNPSNCRVYYAHPSGAGLSPIIRLRTTGC